MKNLVLGNEALAQGAIDSGISGIYAYPGTPSTEITEYIQMSVMHNCCLREDLPAISYSLSLYL